MLYHRAKHEVQDRGHGCSEYICMYTGHIYMARVKSYVCIQAIYGPCQIVHAFADSIKPRESCRQAFCFLSCVWTRPHHTQGVCVFGNTCSALTHPRDSLQCECHLMLSVLVCCATAFSSRSRNSGRPNQTVFGCHSATISNNQRCTAFVIKML